jgi:hypothetical protein
MMLGGMRNYVTRSAEMFSADDSLPLKSYVRAPSPVPPEGASELPSPPAQKSRRLLSEARMDLKSAKGLASPFLSLAARLVLRSNDRLVVEFEVEEDGFDWSPGTKALIRLADGKVVEVEVDQAATTAPGELDGGTTVRLVLRLTQRLTAKEVPVGVELSDGALELSLPPGSR